MSKLAHSLGNSPTAFKRDPGKLVAPAQKKCRNYNYIQHAILYFTILNYTIPYAIHYTLYTIHYRLYAAIPYTLYAIPYILYTIYNKIFYILYTVHYILC